MDGATPSHPADSPYIPVTRSATLLPIVLAALAALAGLVPHAPAFDPFNRNPAVAPEPDKEDLETLTRVQIFLDENLFTPGKIDGRIGEFTRKAVAHYNAAHGISPLDNWAAVLDRSAALVPNVFTTYTIREEDSAFVNPGMPTSPEAQSKLKILNYRRFSELVSERFHCDEPFLEKINPDTNVHSLRPGDTLNVPNVISPFLIEDVPKYNKYPEDPALSARNVIIDTGVKIAAVYDPDGTLVASFPITPGEERFIHRGHWKLVTMVSTPEFRWDDSMLNQGVRSESAFQLPPGPNNPVGVLWAGTSKSGIGMHGTASPETIGRARSAGCIRLANWDAIRLPTILRPGAQVEIR
ncbi:L,D-transpeptidase [soil metagenome]